MTSHHTTADRQDAPFIIPGNAFAALLSMTVAGLGAWLHRWRELRRQRRDMRHLRTLDDRMLRDIGIDRSEIPFVVTQGRKEH